MEKKQLTALDVLDVLIKRMEKRADVLEGVRLRDFELATEELRKFASMTRKAREYLAKQKLDGG